MRAWHLGASWPEFVSGRGPARFLTRSGLHAYLMIEAVQDTRGLQLAGILFRR